MPQLKLLNGGWELILNEHEERYKRCNNCLQELIGDNRKSFYFCAILKKVYCLDCENLPPKHHPLCGIMLTAANPEHGHHHIITQTKRLKEE